DAFDLCERTESLGFDLLELALADDVELPASQLSRQANVLAFAANGQTELFVGDDQLHAVIGFVDDDLVHVRGLNRVDDVASRIFVERNDVDLLTAEFLHDRLNARTFDADASAYCIDVRVPRRDRYLAARASLSGNANDADDA